MCCCSIWGCWWFFCWVRVVVWMVGFCYLVLFWWLLGFDCCCGIYLFFRCVGWFWFGSGFCWLCFVGIFCLVWCGCLWLGLDIWIYCGWCCGFCFWWLVRCGCFVCVVVWWCVGCGWDIFGLGVCFFGLLESWCFWCGIFFWFLWLWLDFLLWVG